MVSSRQTAMIIIAHCESKLVKLTLLCDVGQPYYVRSVLIGWQKNVITAVHTNLPIFVIKELSLVSHLFLKTDVS